MPQIVVVILVVVALALALVFMLLGGLGTLAYNYPLPFILTSGFLVLLVFIVRETRKADRQRAERQAAARRALWELEEAERRAVREAQEAAEQATRREREAGERRYQEQINLRLKLNRLQSQLTLLPDRIATEKSVAAQMIEAAEAAFAHRRFERFWNNVENARDSFATIEKLIEDLRSSAIDHRRTSSQLEGGLPAFDEPSVPAPPNATAQRLCAILLRAESDIDFWTVYDRMRERRERRQSQERMESRLSDIADSIRSLDSRLTASMKEATDAIHDAAEAVRSATDRSRQGRVADSEPHRNT